MLAWSWRSSAMVLWEGEEGWRDFWALMAASERAHSHVNCALRAPGEAGPAAATAGRRVGGIEYRVWTCAFLGVRLSKI